jgi:hypothetical protein
MGEEKKRRGEEDGDEKRDERNSCSLSLQGLQIMTVIYSYEYILCREMSFKEKEVGS